MVFLDFDGTITKRDVVDVILEEFADPRWLTIEEDWKSGQIGSRECLSKQMQLVRATKDQMDALLNSIEVDKALVRLLDTCAVHGVEVHILSDGFDYCIDRILGRPSLNLKERLGRTRILSSHIEVDKNQWQVDFPSFHQSCAHGCATCKPAMMRLLNPNCGPAIFIGDGLSDKYAAASADLVFAKDKLANFCLAEQISYHPYKNLSEVADQLDQLLSANVALARDLVERASAGA